MFILTCSTKRDVAPAFSLPPTAPLKSAYNKIWSGPLADPSSPLRNSRIRQSPVHGPTPLYKTLTFAFSLPAVFPEPPPGPPVFDRSSIKTVLHVNVYILSCLPHIELNRPAAALALATRRTCPASLHTRPTCRNNISFTVSFFKE